MLLQGKSAIVTGSTSGIGLGIAQALAKQGAHVLLNGFGNPVEIESERQAIKKDYGVKALYSGADMSKPDQIRAMVQEAVSAFGSVDILVNNAGIQHVQPVDEFDDGKWDAIIAINLSSNFHAIKAAVPGMKKKGWGRIINVASVHGLVASPYKSAYVSSKHGVIGLTKAVALDLAEFGITCNAVCPGYVDTPLVRKQIPQQAKEHGISEEDVIGKVLLKNHAIKRFVAVDDLSALTVFLCTDAAQTLTGTAIPMDGGWTAH